MSLAAGEALIVAVGLAAARGRFVPCGRSRAFPPPAGLDAANCRGARRRLWEAPAPFRLLSLLVAARGTACRLTPHFSSPRAARSFARSTALHPCPASPRILSASFRDQGLVVHVA